MYIERREKREGKGEREREKERERERGRERERWRKGIKVMLSWLLKVDSQSSLPTPEHQNGCRKLKASLSVSSVSGQGACQLSESLYIWRHVDERKSIWDALTVPSPPLPKPTTTAFCEDWDTMALFIFCLECWVPAHCLSTSYSLCLECYSSWNLHKSYNPFLDRPFLSSMCLL